MKRDVGHVSAEAAAVAVDRKRLFGENGETLAIVSNSEQLKIFVLAAENFSANQLVQLRQTATVAAFGFSDSTEYPSLLDARRCLCCRFPHAVSDGTATPDDSDPLPADPEPARKWRWSVDLGTSRRLDFARWSTHYATQCATIAPVHAAEVTRTGAEVAVRRPEQRSKRSEKRSGRRA